MPSAAFLTRVLQTALILGFGPATALAGSDPAQECTKAARAASEATQVPFQVLLALSIVESGRDQRPWPWTVNIDGEGHWLDGSEDAVTLASAAIATGLTNVDIGCFQLNYRWHGTAFHSIEDMLDPGRNALYAARFLADHYGRTGDWARAAAAYHSSTPVHAERYQARYEETAARLAGVRAEGEQPPTPRGNGFPLLIAGATGQKGSLVPATAGGLRLFGGP